MKKTSKNYGEVLLQTSIKMLPSKVKSEVKQLCPLGKAFRGDLS